MKIGNDFLSPTERQLFIDILFDYEGTIAFDESEMSLLDPSIEPSYCHSHDTSHALATAELTSSESDAGRCDRARQRKVSLWNTQIITRALPKSLFSDSEEET